METLIFLPFDGIISADGFWVVLFAAVIFATFVIFATVGWLALIALFDVLIFLAARLASIDFLFNSAISNFCFLASAIAATLASAKAFF